MIAFDSINEMPPHLKQCFECSHQERIIKRSQVLLYMLENDSKTQIISKFETLLQQLSGCFSQIMHSHQNEVFPEALLMMRQLFSNL